ncbi:MAG: NYN domain-containing protein [Acidobacteria bacterium]|nr:NYN domain-containing protein [Acidobacteriota bacterium]
MALKDFTEPTYLFIDAEHLRQYYSEFAMGWFGEEGRINFDRIKSVAGALRLFYYDSLDEKRKPKESEADFEQRIKARQGEYADVRSVRGAHVRLGTVTGEKRRQQKQVDILLAVDMMNHAVRQNMKRAVLLTGDQDFKPVVDSLVLLGTFVEVWGDQRHTSSNLVEAADSHRMLTAREYHDFSVESFKQKQPLPESLSIVYKDDYYEGELWARGRLGNRTFVQSKVGNQWHIYALEPGRDVAIVYSSPNEGRLRLYLKLFYDDVQWESAAD